MDFDRLVCPKEQEDPFRLRLQCRKEGRRERGEEGGEMPSYGYSWSVIRDWLIGGVDFNLAGNGGPTCTEFTANPRRVLELLFGVVFGCGLFYWAYK